MAVSAIESLIALSDTICPPLPQATAVGSGNFFGPWLTDEKWSPRKPASDATVSPKKKANSRGNPMSKSLPRRLSMFTSANINNSPYSSPYGAQRTDSSLDESSFGRSKLRLTTKARTFVAGTGSRKQIKGRSQRGKGGKTSKKYRRGAEEAEEDEELGGEEEEEPTNMNKHSYFQKPSLPALITLTSNTNDARSTFALGRQLELPLPRVYVSVAQRQSVKSDRQSVKSDRAKSATLPLTASNPSQAYTYLNTRDYGTGNSLDIYNATGIGAPSFQRGRENNAVSGANMFTYRSNGGERDVSQCRAEALKRALEVRNPPPPTHNHDDISEHMRYYRIHCTVLGTGRFSLANEPEQKEVKPVQWQVLFPHRPLTAAGSIVDVPIFRFSVADFRIQTAPSMKGSRSSPSPLLRAVTPKYLAKEDKIAKVGVVSVDQTDIGGECSDTSTVSDEKQLAEGVGGKTTTGTLEKKSGSLQLEERFARASKVSSYTVYNDSIQEVTQPTTSQPGEDNEYMKYLRSKNGSIRPAGFQHKGSGNPENDEKNLKSVQQDSKSSFRNDEGKQSMNPDPVPSGGEEEEYVSSRSKKRVSREPKLMKGSNFRGRKCEGQYGPSTQPYHRSIGTGLVSRGRYFSTDIPQGPRLPAPRLVVDADKLRESVDEKIDEGERRFRSSINEAMLHQIISARGKKRLWQRIRKRENSFLNASLQGNQESADSLTDNDATNANQDAPEESKDFESVDLFDEGNDSEAGVDQEIRTKAITREERTGVTLYPRKNIGVVTSYDFKGYVEALRAKSERYLEGTEDNDQEDNPQEIEDEDQLPSTSGTFVVSNKRSWHPKESRVRSAARGGKYRLRYSKKPETRSRSRVGSSDNATDFTRNSASAGLRYKPTSPATSAFVIAAPPNSGVTGAGGRSVVLPLEDFMEMAVEGRDKSFADWKMCLNNSSLGSMSRPQGSGGQRSRSDGLLKVVSFATPVNQFIFAKKITFDSTQNLGVFPSDKKKKKKREEENSGELAGKITRSSRYRLRLSDFGLPETFRRKTSSNSKDGPEPVNEKSTDAVTENNGVDEIDHTNENRNKSLDRMNKLQDSLTLAMDMSDMGYGKQDFKQQRNSAKHIKDTDRKHSKAEPMPVVNELPEQNRLASPDAKLKAESEARRKAESLPTGSMKAFDIREKPKQARSRSVSAEAHACLRKEILRLMEHNKSTTAANPEETSEPHSSTVEGKKNWSESKDIKGVPVSKLLEDETEQTTAKQDSTGTTTHSHGTSGAFNFRFNRQSSSLSPRRLTLKHRVRRLSDRERSLSPSSVHRYFQRRRSSTEVKQDDLDLNLPPLTIQGGGISRPTSEKADGHASLPVPNTEDGNVTPSSPLTRSSSLVSRGEGEPSSLEHGKEENGEAKKTSVDRDIHPETTNGNVTQGDCSDDESKSRRVLIGRGKAMKYVRFSVDL